jgi:hypothetical protein
VAHAGEVIENPVTGERVVFRQTARDTGGELLQFDLMPAARLLGYHARYRRHST